MDEEKEMREFDDDEKKFAQKNVDERKAVVKHLKLMVEYNDFMLGKMLESNYLEKRRGYEKQNRELKAEIKENDAIIDVTERQIVEGVEVKEKVEMPGIA